MPSINHPQWVGIFLKGNDFILNTTYNDTKKKM